jgi:hypothetical protein
MENFSTVDLVIIGVALCAIAWFGWNILTDNKKGTNPFNSGTSTPTDEPSPTNPVETVKPKTDGE